MKFYKKYILAALMLVSALAVTGCKNVKIREIVGKYETEPTQAVKVAAESEYTRLGSESEIIELLLTTMKNNMGSCSFNVENEDMINTASWMAKLGGISDISVEETKVSDGYNVYVSLKYWDNYPIMHAYDKNDMTGLTDRQLELLNAYYDIAAQIIKPDMTDYEKELAVHDYLVQNTEYTESTDSGSDMSAYGAIIQKKATAAGFAESFKTILDMSGVDCQVINGTKADASYTWNIVKLDGEWYHVDVAGDKSSDGISHKYFNVSDVEMSTRCEWDNENYPVCTGEKYSYYVTGDITMINSQEEFNEYLKQCIEQQQTDIETVVYADINLEEALKYAGASFEYTYNIIDRNSFKVYEMNIQYK